MISNFISNFFRFDSLAIIMTSLIVFIATTVSNFAFRYMKGDKQYHKFFSLIFVLVAFLVIMVSANHGLIFLLFWFLSNITLVFLMMHKSSWPQAKASALLAAKTYSIGYFFILLAFILLYVETGDIYIHSIIYHDVNSPLMICALIFLLIGAMAQSAIIPFHTWLLSSLNSPTPVSAIMHAGLINGGGFLLIRFAPLYAQQPVMLTIIFMIGLLSAIIGTFCKLLQSDIKRMLACSTIAQMGYMIAQCGLGLFPAAVAHLFLHGLCKAYLFLNLNNAAHQKKIDFFHKPNLIFFVYSLVCGIAGSYAFMLLHKKHLLAYDTSLCMVFVAYIVSVQCVLSLLSKNAANRFPLACIFAIIVGLLYGLILHGIEYLVSGINLLHPQPINLFHIIGMILFFIVWLVVIFIEHFKSQKQAPSWIIKIYVMLINFSQPHKSTITAHRNQYKCL